ncbi:hypothetical protein [Streptomyces sp. NBC_00448]|uniref:hypothetical protein n=1 Tax=Streptomyces sp. NBC_00448 TaxID=2903652 RepID=UPI002E21EAEB
MDGWERKALRAAEFVAYPALAGAAFCVLALGVVTWLPALAAAATALQSWRTDGSDRCFTATLRAFPAQWRRLRGEALLGTAVLLLCVSNTVFLVGRSGPALALLPVQAVLLAAAAVYAVALAVTTTLQPDADRRELHQAAAVFAFGSPWRTLGLVAAVAVLPLSVLPVPLGPVLLGPTLPLMAALSLAAPVTPAGLRAAPGVYGRGPSGGASSAAPHGPARPAPSPL